MTAGALARTAGALARTPGALPRPVGALARPVGALGKPVGALGKPVGALAWSLDRSLVPLQEPGPVKEAWSSVYHRHSRTGAL